MRALAEALTAETRAMYTAENPKSSASGVLQQLISLVTEIKDKYNITLSESWFENCSEVYALMQGLEERSDKLLPALFDIFKTNHNISSEIVRESAHPYAKALSTKEIYCKGADVLDIKFDTESACDPNETILFTLDKARTVPAESGAAMSAGKAAWD
jgi:hypothetical protein